MRAMILSDLHLAHWRGDNQIHLPEEAPDVVILAGDIASAAHAVSWATLVFGDIPVLYVPGNHEYYDYQLELVEAAIATNCTLHNSVHFLQMGERIIGGVRFLGCTLWTDFALFGQAQREANMRIVEATLNDFKYISYGQDKHLLRAKDTAQINAQHTAWLRTKLAEPFLGKTVVITHHLPSMRSVAPRWRDDPVTAGFASNHDDLVRQADLWVHGHTHDSMDYTIDQCRVLCNPRGYRQFNGKPENSDFHPYLVIEL